MTHPLTDEMIKGLWNDCSSSLVNMEDPIDSQVIRAAYDLGRKHQTDLHNQYYQIIGENNDPSTD